ncbi:MAG: tyrosine-protein phosphatase, partial [Clostridia bacterium]|nr:tyrosine-protein phosphatase [Clostridia bacterium]
MKRILILLLLVALLLPLCSCGKNKAEATTAATETAENEPLNCTVRAVPISGNVSLVNESVAAYLADTIHSANDYAEGKEELSRPNPVVLRWDVDFTAGENNLRYFVVQIWTKTDKSDARSFLVGRSEREYRFYNAYAGQKYLWNVTAYGADGVTFASSVNVFRTEDKTPRDLYVDGVTNVRDLGGRVTEDGGRVRQGLLFRGAKLDWKGIRMITDKGIKTMTQTLGIKTELDLRTDSEAGNITKSFLGDGVNYVRRTLGGGFAPDSTLRSNLKKVFAVLSDENNYPIFFHCAAGADRTGLVAWFVNGLLGVSEEDLWRDYLLTNFGDVGGSRDKSYIESKYVKTLNNRTEKTYAEKVYNYLKDEVGVPTEQLDAVIRIMKIRGAAVETNAMPAIPAGHTHTPESEDVVLYEATCSYPGIRVGYCSVCGEFIGDTVAELPINPDAHEADWNVIRQPNVTDQADGSRTGTCVLCGKYVEQTTHFSPSILSCTDRVGGTFTPVQVSFADVTRGAHFYPTANDSAGNDLLVEYSVFYNKTMLNLDTEKCDPYITTRINAETVVYWSPTSNISPAWCKYAGGFEGMEDNFIIPVSDGTV